MEHNGQFGDYNIDVCLCIDKTGSMSPIIDTVKNNALNLYSDILKSLEKEKKYVNRFRIRVIWFGDYLADGDQAMLVSPFLTMPDELEKLRSYITCITAHGGGDTPEDGLEALSYAIRSDWCNDGWKRRHIIAIFTDAPAHEMGFSKVAPSYPKTGMPTSFGELYRMWGLSAQNPGEMEYSAKRLLLFTPDTSFWHTMKEHWTKTIMRTAREKTGLEDISYQVMLDTIVNSVGD